MPKKEPLLYLQKSKAAEEEDYEFYYDSENFQRKSEKPHKIKRKYYYKNIHEFPQSEDPSDEKRRDKHDFYSNSYYAYDVGNDKYLEYIEETSDSSDSEVEEERFKNNKKDRNKIPENVKYNQQIKESSHSKKQRISPFDHNEIKSMRNKKDFDVYMSQRPIVLRYENQEALGEPLKYIQKRRDNKNELKGMKIPSANNKPSKKREKKFKNISSDNVFGQQGGSPQVYSTLIEPPSTTIPLHIKDLTSNISNNSPNSVMQLIYLPVYVMNNDKELPSTSNGQPALGLVVNESNKHPFGNVGMTDPQNMLSVFKAISNNQNSVFEQKTKNTNKESKVSPRSQRANKNKSTERKRKDFTKEEEHKLGEIKKKLCVSPLGHAMSPDSYAALILSQSEQESDKSEPAFITAVRNLNRKGKVSKIKPDNADKNDHQEINSKLKPGKEVVSGRSYIKNDQILKQENQENKNEKDSQRNSKKEEREASYTKQTLKEDDNSFFIENKDLEPMNQTKNIIININTSQTKEEETNKKSKILERRSLIDKKQDLKGTEKSTIINNEYYVGEAIPQNNGNEGKKNSLASTFYRTISQDELNGGKNKSVSNNQINNISKKTLEIPMEETSYIAKTNFMLNGNKSRNKSNVIQTGENKEYLNNTKSILKKENLSATKQSKSAEDLGINPNNKESQIIKVKLKKGYKKKQDFDNNSIKPLSTINSKDQGLDELGSRSLIGSVTQSSQVVFEEDVGNKSVHENQVDNKFSNQSLVENPTLEIIHQPPQKSLSRQSRNNEIFLENENLCEKLPDNRINTLFKQTEDLLLDSFYTAQFLLGVSCYDKLTDVVDFVYYKDD